MQTIIEMLLSWEVDKAQDLPLALYAPMDGFLTSYNRSWRTMGMTIGVGINENVATTVPYMQRF